MKVDGASSLSLAADGALQAHTDHGPIAFTPPVAFQISDTGQQISVAVAYTLDSGQQQYGFRLGSYGASRPLVIDPFLQSTYLGGNGIDEVYGMAIHPLSDEVYIAGSAASSDFPSRDVASGGVATGAQTALSGATDAFVSRLNAGLTQRLQTSYFGGSGTDGALAIAIHSVSGEIYVAGSTESADLPGRAAASGGAATGAQSVKSTGTDAFVVRFNAALTQYLQSTYLGGSGTDSATLIAIHPTNGDVYLAGRTDSTDLPSRNVASGGQGLGAQSVVGGQYDAFIARFNAANSDHIPRWKF